MNAVSPVMYGRTVEPADRDTEEGISQRVECPPPGDPKCFLSAEILGCPVPLRGTVSWMWNEKAEFS